MSSPAHARYDQPVRFYALATAIPWVLWFGAAWWSHGGGPAADVAVVALGLAGLAAPLGVVAWLTRRDPAVRADIRARVGLRGVSWRWLLLAAFGMQLAVFVATAISVLVGYPLDQFGLRPGGSTFAVGVIPAWVVLILAPILEEASWHSYGTDALRTRFSVFTTSMVFAVIWALWHLPLAFIQGSSQQETVEQGWLHALNFPLSIIPFVLLINWVYYRTGRSIAVTMLFHAGANLSTQVFHTHPDTELIVTLLLLVVTALVVVHDRELFFAPPARHAPRPAALPSPAA